MPNYKVAFLVLAVSAPSIALGQGNGIRLSDAGPEGSFFFAASFSSVAYNPVDKEYLVVWGGTDDRDGQVMEESEIFAQRVDARTGQQLGVNDLRISAFEGLGDPREDAFLPDVVYNPDAHEYLVVWNVTTEAEGWSSIYGQRLDARTGAQIGVDDFEVTVNFDGAYPAVTYNSTSQQYLVAFQSDDGSGQAVGEFEIFVTLLSGSSGAVVLPPERISTTGPELDSDYLAVRPDVAADPALNRYVVTWQANDTDDEGSRIYFRMLTGAGAPIRAARPLSIGQTPATEAAIAHDPTAGSRGEYFVVWQFRQGDSEIYGRRINGGTGHALAGPNLLISDTDPSNDSHAHKASISSGPGMSGYLVTWRGSDAELASSEDEIFGTYVAPQGMRGTRIRLSHAGGTGFASYAVSAPAVALTDTGNAFVTWHGQDDRPTMDESETEIFGEHVSDATFADGFESGDMGRWSGVTR